MTRQITEGGYYYNKCLKGIDKTQMQWDVPLLISTSEDVGFSLLEISDCGIPFRQIGNGKVEIDHLILSNFTADAFNSNGNLHIHHLEVDYFNPNYVYNDDYHVDALGQFFGLGKVSNVTIDRITARIRGKYIQGIMLSEPIKYSDFSVGVEGVDLEIDYDFGFVANTLEDSFLNLGNSQIKIKKVKPSNHVTSNIWIEVEDGLIHHKHGDIII